MSWWSQRRRWRMRGAGAEGIASLIVNPAAAARTIHRGWGAP
jgi:hypothetical protein